MIIRRFLFLYFLAASIALANPLVQEMDQAQPDAGELQRAKEQLEKSSPEAVETPLFVPPFHKRKVAQALPATFCRSCHQQNPHRSNARKRAFLNMHSRYISCETCHWRPEGEQLAYAWMQVPGSSHARGMIVPRLKGEPVLIAESIPWARVLKQQWEEADEAGKVEIKAKLHHPLREKGPGCGACHGNEDALLDYGLLGYKPQRARELELNPTARFIERTEPRSADEPVRRIHIRDLLE
ncbi:hypothetical protein [Thiolapillus sp.]